ncbi:hypothetical protein [Helcococcus bovis]|uniref:DUF4181 domain-containing protein n=1 Tax=Helcococcus bovis TaxID=3153252 RepID=A0ABW9F7V6_9FIRM
MFKYDYDKKEDLMRYKSSNLGVGIMLMVYIVLLTMSFWMKFDMRSANVLFWSYFLGEELYITIKKFKEYGKANLVFKIVIIIALTILFIDALQKLLN